MDYLVHQNVLEENILVTLGRRMTEIWGKGRKEFEKFRKTLITCEGDRIRGI